MAEIRIGEYLFRRLKQMGIETAFGVPGGNAASTNSPSAQKKNF